MSWFNGFAIGALLMGAIGFAASHNHGRGAPLLSNPFAELGFVEHVRDVASDFEDAAWERAEAAAEAADE